MRVLSHAKRPFSAPLHAQGDSGDKPALSPHPAHVNPSPPEVYHSGPLPWQDAGPQTAPHRGGLLHSSVIKTPLCGVYAWSCNRFLLSKVETTGDTYTADRVLTSPPPPAMSSSLAGAEMPSASSPPSAPVNREPPGRDNCKHSDTAEC